MSSGFFQYWGIPGDSSAMQRCVPPQIWAHIDIFDETVAYFYCICIALQQQNTWKLSPNAVARMNGGTEIHLAQQYGVVHISLFIFIFFYILY